MLVESYKKKGLSMRKFTIALLRVSGLDQETDLQKHGLDEEIRKRKLTPITLAEFQEDRDKYVNEDPKQDHYYPVCIVVEDKSTGRNEKRSGYQWALGEVQAGHVQAVLVYRGDRIGRSVVGNWNFAKACQDRKTELFSLKDKFDLTTPLGKAMFSMLSAMAEYQSDVYSENVKQAIASKKAKAEKDGLPYHHGGTSKGWSHKRLIKQLPAFYKLVELGLSNYGIREILKWNYRTIRKYRALDPNLVIDRKTLNTKVYGKSDAVI